MSAGAQLEGDASVPRRINEGGRLPINRGQVALITVLAFGVFLGLRLLPTGTNLNHMDFRVDAKNAIEFCDPLNPQFIPVVAVRSPVTMTISTGEPPVAENVVHAMVTLRTANGKAIAPQDLIVAHTRKLHLLIVDPTLNDYQHVHPEPAKERGEWSFAFTPRVSGAYRVFADFTPAATGRGLYASVDINVDGRRSSNSGPIFGIAPTTVGDRRPLLAVDRDGFVFSLMPGSQALRAGRTIDLAFSIVRNDGEPVALAPVMGAFAHLVAFDDARSGFAHLHPNETDLTKPPDVRRPVLNFKVTMPRAGAYAIWAQVNVSGREVFVPFRIEVAE